MLRFYYKIIKPRHHIKNFKTSSFILIIIAAFFIIDFVGYKILRDQIILNNENDTKILVSELNHKTNNLLTQLLFEFNTVKPKMIQKHHDVLEYITKQTIPLIEINLQEMHHKINIDEELTQPYNINITTKDLYIANSSLDKELGFDLKFSKSLFDKHKSENILMACPPLFEKSTQSFFSFTDGYVTKNDDEKASLLQISYRFKNRNLELRDIQKSVHNHPAVKELKAFTFGEEGFIHDIILHDYKAYKPDLQEFFITMKDGERIKKRLGNKTLHTERFVLDGVHFKSIDLLSKNVLFTNTHIVFSILIDETDYLNELQKLSLWLIIVSILGLISLLIIFNLRDKEKRLSQQDIFIKASMHEIKTPLSIIILNNDLREMEFGKDDYSNEIDSAIKLLKTSYDDMDFTINKNEFNYPIENIDLQELVEQRVEYFKTIARSKDKHLSTQINSKCVVQSSIIEMTRLIDNNLSNAIKYADNDSTISITLNDNILYFHNLGTPIKDTKLVFEKYFRENNIVGGHGLGLSIISDIAKKYKIKIVLSSNKKEGTTFTYTLKCHTNDISRQ